MSLAWTAQENEEEEEEEEEEEGHMRSQNKGEFWGETHVLTIKWTIINVVDGVIHLHQVETWAKDERLRLDQVQVLAK